MLLINTMKRRLVSCMLTAVIVALVAMPAPAQFKGAQFKGKSPQKGGKFQGNLSPQQKAPQQKAPQQKAPQKKTPGAKAARSRIDSIPEQHKAYLQKLEQYRNVDFKNTFSHDALADLSATLGVPIKMHPSVVAAQKTGKIAVEIRDPVTHERAISMAMQYAGVNSPRLHFADDHILVVDSTFTGPSMHIIDLQRQSNYTTRVRAKAMLDIRQNVARESWQQPNAWISESHSVFAIRIYSTMSVYKQVAQYFDDGWHVWIDDPDVAKIRAMTGRTNDPEKLSEAKAAVENLRQKFKFKSLKDRLAYETKRTESGDPKLTNAATERLAARERPVFRLHGARSETLKLLHEEEVTKFIAREGFGLSRRPTFVVKPTPSQLPTQPEKRYPLALDLEPESAGQQIVALPTTNADPIARWLPSTQSLGSLHRTSEQIFLSPNRFGFIKNKENVAGFDPHAFEGLPRLHQLQGQTGYLTPKEHWAMRRLELVSLLKYDEPKVYLSDALPRMSELVKAKTRSLTQFEKAALTKFLQGEDMVTKASVNKIEMVGSLRAIDQCTKCHDVKRGALLGAFSYELRRDPLLPVDKLPKPKQAEIF